MKENTDNGSKTAAFLTHELRSPLTAILCALQIMKEDRKEGNNPDKEYLLDTALQNAERLNRLIDDVMDSSKIQAGRLKMKPIPCDASSIARALQLLSSHGQNVKKSHFE